MARWLEANPEHPEWKARYERFAAYLRDVVTPALEAIRLGPDADGFFACRVCHARTSARIFATWKAMICPACYRGRDPLHLSTPTRTKRHMREMEESAWN